MAKTIFFVRHGETEANATGIISGGEHDTPLTKNGEAQAKKAGEDLKNKKIEGIVCSPQGRAVQTATIIANEIGYDPDEVKTNRLFAEIGMGPYAGKPRDIYYADKEAGTVESGTETKEDHFKRAQAGLEYLRSLPQDRILVVSHNATTRMTKAIVQGLHHNDLHLVERIGNAEILEFTLE